MKYRNKKTGFVFESTSEIKAEGWEKLNPKPASTPKPKTETTAKKRTAKK